MTALTDREKTLAAILYAAVEFVNETAATRNATFTYEQRMAGKHQINAIREFGKHLDRYLDEREKGK